MRINLHTRLAATYFGLLFLWSGSELRAADEQQLALVLRAQTDFERLERAVGPELPDAARCEQSQAALLAVAPRPEVAVIHFRKGYCTLARAIITHSNKDFLEAAGEFDQAIKAWPDRTVKNAKNKPPEAVSSGLRILLSTARLETGPDAGDVDRYRQELSSAVDPPACSGSFMPTNECVSLLQTGRLWLGWIAIERNDLDRATRDLSGLADSGWGHWTSGKQAFRERRYQESAAQFRQAVNVWTHAQNDPSGSLPARLAPQPDMGRVLTDWGGAQLLTADYPGALATLDAAVKASAHPARALYLRARVKELAGRTEEALADYSLASRTALADAQDLASGEAHLYRGILLYRRHDFVHAEDEFASALNFDIPDAMRPDAVAWRHLAAVAGGSCATSRPALEDSLAPVSPYFPKDEARLRAATCPLTGPRV